MRRRKLDINVNLQKQLGAYTPFHSIDNDKHATCIYLKNIQLGTCAPVYLLRGELNGVAEVRLVREAQRQRRRGHRRAPRVRDFLRRDGAKRFGCLLLLWGLRGCPTCELGLLVRLIFDSDHNRSCRTLAQLCHHLRNDTVAHTKKTGTFSIAVCLTK